MKFKCPLKRLCNYQKMNLLTKKVSAICIQTNCFQLSNTPYSRTSNSKTTNLSLFLAGSFGSLCTQWLLIIPLGAVDKLDEFIQPFRLQGILARGRGRGRGVGGHHWGNGRN